ncbi:hypothetical protein B0H67DRAFT_96467 [Lasiosphaeris hirsuta]|uniref:Uncharacterized protein n=1 Tax=Lasiosphaeris hirsuta TaxID=260670 RepID=A0AA40BDJ2_9PEZI|nr:hypothetical protein B0H67DRAFT_96467 [Lasiosphaeris hirsuta]
MSIPTATAAGPLTTVFTAAPSCSSDFVYYGYSAGLDYVDRDTYSASVCYPLGRLNLLEVYFSPGVCPSGWTSGGYVYTTSFFWAPSLAPDETAAICCPR